MNKDSMIFKIMCLAVCLMLMVSSITVFAQEIDETPDAAVDETVDEAAGETPADEEIVSEPEDAEEEVLDLYAAALRDNGVYVTPGDTIASAFTYNGLRYTVPAGTPNAIKVDGFESDVSISSDSIGDTARNILQATGEITSAAAHSGHFGFDVKNGKFLYRTSVASGSIYVFSAWVKTHGAGISDTGRAFNIVYDNNKSYTVGYNEIGRDIAATNEWQQILFTFKAPVDGVFVIDFDYTGGRSPLYIDDIELYEAELFFNPLLITDVERADADGNAYEYTFSTPGKLTHTITFYNSDVDDVYYTAVMVLFKDGIMIDYQVKESEMALILDYSSVTFEIDIPDDDDISKYEYLIYVTSDTDSTNFYGQVGSKLNPFVARGRN